MGIPPDDPKQSVANSEFMYVVNFDTTDLAFSMFSTGSSYFTAIVRLVVLVTRTSSLVHVAIPDNPHELPAPPATSCLNSNCVALSQASKVIPLRFISNFAEAIVWLSRVSLLVGVFVGDLLGAPLVELVNWGIGWGIKVVYGLLANLQGHCRIGDCADVPQDDGSCR